MIETDNSPLLKINRVIVTGELGCDIKLGSGLNIIKAESIAGNPTSSNDCGKTTFTNLIKYGLGDRDRFGEGVIMNKVDLLFLEVILSDQTVTIRRDLNKPAARAGIFLSKYDERFASQEPDILVNPGTPFSDYLLEQLRIPNLRLPMSDKPGSQPIPITFQTFMRLLYMDQKNSFQEIMNKVLPLWLKGKIVEILLGMAKEEVEQLKARVQELTNDIDELQREISNITQFLVTSGGANRVDIIDTVKEKQKERERLNNEIISVKHQMTGDKGLTDELRESLDRIGQRLIRLLEDRAKVTVKTNDFEALLNSLKIDRDKVLKTNDADYVLSSVDFSKCPRCLQRITAEMKEREHEGNCMVCSRPLLSKTSSTHVLDKDEIVEEEIAEVQLLLTTYSENLETLDLQMSSLNHQKIAVQRELDIRSSSYVSPFVDTLERLLNNANRVDSELELLNQQLKQWQLIDVGKFVSELQKFRLN